MKRIGFMKWWLLCITMLVTILTAWKTSSMAWGMEPIRTAANGSLRVADGNRVSCLNVWSASGSPSSSPMTIYYDQSDAGLSAPQIIYLRDENVNSVFCIQYGSALSSGNVITVCGEGEYQKLNPQQKEAISQVLGCASMVTAPRDANGGYNEVNTGSCTFQNFQTYNATQLMLWYYIDVYSGRPGSGNTGGITWEGVVRTCAAGWGNLSECQRIKETVDHMKDIPGFSVRETAQIKPVTLHYDPADRRYEAFVTDSAQVLSQYAILGGEGLKIIRCQENGMADETGNSLLIYRETALKHGEAPITLTFHKEGEGGTLIYLKNQSEPQDLICISGKTGFAVDSYMAVDTTHTRVEIEKLDAETGKPLEGVSLQLWKGEELVTQWVTGTEPYLLYDLDIGSIYCLREIAPLDGYAGMEEHSFLLTQDGESKRITLYNQKTAVDISKQDLTGTQELPGARLELYEGETRIETWVSGDKPHRIYGLTVGKAYTLRETLAPKGYAAAEEITFTVTDTDEVQRIVMKDHRIQGRLHIMKRDEQGKGLKGAEFYLYQRSYIPEEKQEEVEAEPLKSDLGKKQEETDKWIASYTTDENGEIWIEDLEYGAYYLVEYKAPKGYICSEEIYEFQIETDGEQCEIVLENKPETPKTETEQPTSEAVTKAPELVAGVSMWKEETPQTGDSATPFLAFAFMMGAVIVSFYFSKQKK